MQTQSTISITVKASNESKYTISTNLSDTVLQLKTRLAVQEGCDTPPGRMRLIFSGRVLKDFDTLEMYKLADGHTVHMVRSSINTTAAAAPTLTPSSALPSMTTTMGSDAGRGSDGGIAGTSGHSIFDSHSRTNISHTAIGGMDQQLPMVMAQMMQDRNFAQYMSAMLQNPQVLDSMLAMNPALQDIGGGAEQIRARLRSRQFQQMIANPDMLRDVAQMGSRLGGMTNGMNTFRGETGGMFTPLVDLNPSLTISTPSRAPPTTAVAVAAAVSMMREVPGQAQQATEERFQVQLRQLNDMGFWDAAKNIRALVVADGNVDIAIELLFSRSA
ncbi:hypothetical protein BGZ51_003266 [Haplosporangium sp. Z 767]|nr:hypothetical protein BGZ51_003266 [Haplosporangium sp. Z 767]